MSDEPPRILDDEGADPNLRAELRAYASAAPSLDYAAGAAVLAAHLRAPASAPGAPSGGSGIGTWIGGSVVTGVIAIGVVMWWLHRPDVAPREEHPPSELPAALADRDAAAPSAAEPTSLAPSIEPTAAPEVLVAPAPSTTSHATASRHAPSGLALEMQLLSSARRALDSSPARTLSLMDRADREVGPGTFGEERSALRVLALAQLGRHDEAARLGRAFLAEHPSGLFSDRVRRAVEGSQ